MISFFGAKKKKPLLYGYIKTTSSNELSFFLRWSLYHPVIISSFLFFSGGCSATLSITNIHYSSTKNKLFPS